MAGLALCVLTAHGSDEPTAAFGETDGIVVPGNAGLAADATVWFRVAKAGRTLASGSVAAFAGEPLRIPVALPDLKPGVAMPLELTLRRGGDAGESLFEGRLWAFSRQPVGPGHDPVAPRTLHLYDPEGRTDAALREVGLPFERVARLEALGALRDAVIVVGEGLSLDEERGLTDALAEAVGRGNDALLLAPREGTLALPSAWTRLVAGTIRDVFPAPKQGAGGQGADSAAFVRPDPAERTGFRLSGLRDEAVFGVADRAGVEAVGWETVGSEGRFRACGARLVARWETSPAARWLLVELLEHFSKKGTSP